MSIGIVASSYVAAGGGGGFSPADVTGLAAWYDATQITGLSNGDAVATWSDLSGNTRHMTGTNTPLYQTSGVNGLASVLFDDTFNEFFDSPAVTDLNLTGNFLVIASVRLNTVGAGQRTIMGKSFQRWELFESAGKFGAYVGGSSNGIYNPGGGTSVSTGVDYVVAMRRTSTNAFSTRVNGSQDATATNSASGSDGAKATIGARPGTGLFFDGYIGEICVYNQDVSASDLTDIETYFVNKWT